MPNYLINTVLTTVEQKDFVDAISTGNSKKIKSYLAKKFDINSQLKIPQHKAVPPIFFTLSTYPGACTSLPLLLKQPDININIQDENGQTPLMWTAAGEHYVAMKILIKHGADYNLTDIQGNTCLDLINDRHAKHMIIHYITKYEEGNPTQKYSKASGQPKFKILDWLRGKSHIAKVTNISNEIQGDAPLSPTIRLKKN